jgi:dipeptidyl aminopeptidase/acylaminoacyl peptidase
MADLREVFDMVTKQTDPDRDSWREQERRQRRAVRNRKIGAMALVAALVIGVVMVALFDRSRTSTAPATGGPTTPPGLGTSTRLFIVDTDSGAKTAFTAPRPSASQFEYSPDGSQIAYSAPDEQGRLEVYVMNADGSNDHQLTHGTSSKNPQWSPDGSMIAFVGLTPDSTSEIFLLDLSDGLTTRLTHEPRDVAADYHQAWAPDGASFLFIESEVQTSSPGYFMAKTIDLATGETRTIGKDVSGPALSPDGTQIVFDAWDSLPTRLSLMSSDGTGRHVIARLDGDGWAMWSPDGQQIAFVRNDPSGVISTYLYDTTTGEIRFVTNGSTEAGGWVGAHSLLIESG